MIRTHDVTRRSVRVDLPLGAAIAGDLQVPDGARGLVLFAHGSGSSRLSPRNQFVASALNDDRFATLLVDLLTEDEERVDDRTAHLRFDVTMLAERLVVVTEWIGRQKAPFSTLPIGLFGASTGAAAALIAAASRPGSFDAIVSRGGRPDLAGRRLAEVEAPTLLIVGERDAQVVAMNKEAMAQMRAHAELVIVPRATHLFEEPGALEKVAALASAWFDRYLTQPGR
jgi:pimeloyl-ACP methyl ester carboxylesterase